MKAKIEITVDELGNLETKSNVVGNDQIRHILDMAMRTLTAPLVISGWKNASKKSDIRRPFPGNGKGGYWPGRPMRPDA